MITRKNFKVAGKETNGTEDPWNVGDSPDYIKVKIGNTEEGPGERKICSFFFSEMD